MILEIGGFGYEYKMVRKDEGVVAEREHYLYCVIVTSHKGTETHYVLAPSEKHAIGMAETAAGLESYKLPDDVYKLVKCHATRLPLTVQGWGKAKF
jgi:hypothetical protein